MAHQSSRERIMSDEQVIDIRGVITAWHNISNSTPSKIDGVLFQDIYSIVSEFLKLPEVVAWDSTVKDLHAHLVDYNQPHKVTIDQLPTSVIELFYDVWKREGYRGDLSYFIDLVFTYIQVGAYLLVHQTETAQTLESIRAANTYLAENNILANEMPIEENERIYSEEIQKKIATTVYQVCQRLKKHNEELYLVHVDLLNSVFPGDTLHTEPYFSIHGWIGVPCNIADTLSASTAKYRYPLTAGYLGDSITIMTSSAYQTDTYVTIRSADGDSYISVTLNTMEHKLHVACKAVSKPETQIVLDLVGILHTLLYAHNHITIAVAIDKNYVGVQASVAGKLSTLPIVATSGTIQVPVAMLIGKNPSVTFSRMYPTDHLKSITLYTEAFFGEQLDFAMAAFGNYVDWGLTNLGIDNVRPVDDVETCEQWSTKYIKYTTLLANDITNAGKTFAGIVPDSAVRCTAIADDTQQAVKFVSTDIVGNDAEFKYLVKNAEGYSNVATVSIHITKLPDTTGLIYDTEQYAFEYMGMHGSIAPTPEKIVTSWGRFSNDFKYFGPGTAPTDDAALWRLIGTEGFACVRNSSSWTGFVSPLSYSHYTHAVTLSSTYVEDNFIAVVLAYWHNPDNDRNYILQVTRNGSCDKLNKAPSRERGWMLEFVKGKSLYEIPTAPSVIAENVSGDWKILEPATNSVRWSATYPDPNVIVATWDMLSPTRVYVKRAGTKFLVTCTKFRETQPYQASAQMEFDIANYSFLAWAKDPRQYGYSCFAQTGAMFSDIAFTGGLDEGLVVDLSTNKVYQYIDDEWVVVATTIQQIYGYPRIVTNPKTSITYRVEKDAVVKLG